MAVGKPGKYIGVRHFFQLRALVFKSAVQIDNAAAHSNARQHFAGVEWLHQIIVGAGFESLTTLAFSMLLVIRMMYVHTRDLSARMRSHSSRPEHSGIIQSVMMMSGKLS